MIILFDFLSPESIVVRVSCERRKNMMALTALQNVNAKLVENGAVPQPPTQQTPYGLRFPVNGLYPVCSLIHLRGRPRGSARG